MNFTEKTIIITGASSGIGKTTALLFAEKKANLVLIARNKERLAKVELQIKSKGVQAVSIVCDVSDNRQVKNAVKKVQKRFGKIDVLMNNAGFGIYGDFAQAPLKSIRDQMETNYFGTVYCTKAFLPLMKKGSHLVNISSMAGKLAFPGYAGYGASKFAVAGFTESLYHELKPDITVHLICPSGTQTKFFDNASFTGHPHRIYATHMDSPELVANAILKAIEKKQFEVILHMKEKIAVLLRAFLPSMFLKRIYSSYKKREETMKSFKGKKQK
jgi:uncharacterized protein